MRGVGRLIKNELIKVKGQLSWKIISVIILVLAILIPVLNHLTIDSSYTYNSYYKNMYDNSAEGSIEREFFGTYMDIDNYFNDCGITIDDWRYGVYYPEYEQLAVLVKGLELIKSGRSAEEVFDGRYFYSDSIVVNLTGVYYYENESDEDGVLLTSETASEIYNEKKAELDTMAGKVKNSSIADYCSDIIKDLEDQVKDAETAYKTVQTVYNADKSNVYDYQYAKYKLESMKAALDIWKAVSRAEREDESWLISTARRAEVAAEQILDYAVMDKDSFEHNAPAVEEYKTYENYLEINEKGYNDCIAALAMLKHSAETGNPLPNVDSSSARSSIMDAVTSNASVVLFFCMILAATIVASEHTAGTIRVLVIRPRARWKILLSKLLCVIIYGLVMFAAASVLSVITNLIIMGNADLSLPYIVYRDGAVREITPAVYILSYTLLSSLPSILLVFFAFGLSVIMKKVVFAVALPLLVSMFGSVATQLSWMLLHKAPFLKWTIFPYYYISPYLDDPVTKITEYSFADLNYLGLNLSTGIIIILAHIVLAVIISFAVFRKQQIKN